jgi:hypothetical protein
MRQDGDSIVIALHLIVHSLYDELALCLSKPQGRSLRPERRQFHVAATNASAVVGLKFRGGRVERGLMFLHVSLGGHQFSCL